MDKMLSKDRASISSMFNSIAGKYDFLNHFLSLGIDRGWRRKLVKFIKSKSPAKVLDLACGTGDLTISLYKAGLEVIGVDIADKMLGMARAKNSSLKGSKVPKPIYTLASADLIPQPDGSFDAVTIAFGIRNFENRSQSLNEIKRILNDNGSLAILEFATPRNILWRSMFNLYFKNILPLIGRMISKDSNAYSYLPESVKSFPQYQGFCNELSDQGFTNVQYRSLTGGVAVLYTAKK
jgi:demethylmenaquinone methyltransferase / 2-methoxy-6-polyprenyl-1,4-benzoquinol methylase